MARLSSCITKLTSIIVLWQIQNVVCVMEPATGQPSCTFPRGSIACKIWNQTNMDCSRRELMCIPQLSHTASLKLLDLSHNMLTVLLKNAFFGFDALQILDLSSSSISSIQGGTFKGLHNLLTLDLSSNIISFIIEATFAGLSKLKHLDLSNQYIHTDVSISSPFQDLGSLETLSINIRNISSATFSGLTSLQELQIRNIEFLRDDSLSPLPSLLYLTLELKTCNFTEKLLNGLNKLEYLSLSLHTECSSSNVDFCPLVSLQTLDVSNLYTLNLTKNCLKTIPMKSLLLDTYLSKRRVSFKMLNHLTSLYWIMDTSTQALNSLDSPLQNLHLNQLEYLTLNSTTFELCQEWSESLQKLYIAVGNAIFISESPFKWFPKLVVLSLGGLSYSSRVVLTLSNITFSGLSSLEELRLNLLQMDYLPSGILDIFSRYNSFKILDLSLNDMYDDDNLTHQICKVHTSLEQLYLSSDKLTFSYYYPCILSNLKILDVSYQQGLEWIYGPHLDNLFHVVPNLNKLRISHCLWSLHFEVLCSNLITFDSSNGEIIIYNGGFIQAPHLENLYFNGITLNSHALTDISVLNIFKAPKLRIVDLSNNKISVIDKQNASLLNNLTYLDLRHNQLVSLINFQELGSIKELLLGGNKINAVPHTFLSTKPLLSTLDLHDNMFICDCDIEYFQEWIMTDTVVAMWNNISSGNRYMCASPDSLKGKSITEISLDCLTNIVMYILVSAACFAFLIITTILAVRYHWHIQYRLFLLFNRRRNHQNYLVNDDEAPEDYENEGGLPRYDAYVTYHNDDEDWVDGELLPNIEEGDEPFRLCLKTRDIRGGRLKLNELSLRIQRSRKIVVILSPRFVADNWCYFELNMAHQRALEQNYKVLIFIITEKIPNDRLTLVLRQLLCRVQCFKWPADGYGQHLFWQRLREELKRPVPVDRRFNL